MLRRVRDSLRQVLFLMARRPFLFCGAIVLSILVLLAVKFTCSRAKNVVAAARPPVRFFSPEAPVVDLYMGQVDQVERLRSMAEVSLLFFYAPWCAHSMAARQEVQQVAKKLAKQVQFVAVNCWWSLGKCRKQNRFYQYPVIHLFYRRFGPIEYKGPLLAAYIESFILRAITPLTYLPSRAQLEEFLSNHQPGVVGFFQFNSSPQPPGYITYLCSALQALKRDFRGAVRFGLVTNIHVAEAISLREDESVYLHRRFNSSLIFPRRERNFTSEDICRWVFEHRETVLQWLQPPGTKSRLLEKELTKGPALLMFLPHDPLQSQPSAALQQVADIVLRYHSCNYTNESSQEDTLHSSSFSPLCCQSLLLPDSTTSVCEVCLRSPQPSLSLSSSRCSFPSLLQETDILQSYLPHCCLHHLRSPLSTNTTNSIGCRNLLHSYSPFSQYSACCRNVQPQRNDSQAKEDVQRLLLTPPPTSAPPSSVPHQEGDAIAGLRCHTNRTLRFYLLDRTLNWPLAVGLGAAGNQSASREGGGGRGGSADGLFAAIVNLKDEVHYVLHRSPTATLKESLEAFIRNFSAPYSLLPRHLVGEEDKNKNKEESKRPDERPRLVTELTTSSFLPYVMDIEKDVLLFYYTQWCGFCSVLNHIILQLARLLQGNDSITVARVNIARNDLPWEFMVDHVPSIFLFPRYRKHLGAKFPDELPITLPNLVHFILQHSGSLHYADKHSEDPTYPGPGAELLSLQREARALHGAREHLSQQLAQLWRNNRRLASEGQRLQGEQAEQRWVRQSLEEQHQEKSRQLGEALRRLQELADTSEKLRNDNMLLKVLLKMLDDRTEGREKIKEERRKEEPKRRSHLAS